jgi:mRNA interferase RelE/StbE
MLKIKFSKRAADFLTTLQRSQPKHAKQIARKLHDLQDKDGIVHDVKELIGMSPYKRADQGEYRIVFVVEDGTLVVELIGKRNDDEVYRQLKRVLK